MKRANFLQSLMGVPFIPGVLKNLSRDFTEPLEEDKWVNSIFKSAVWIDSKYNTAEIGGDTIRFDNYRKSYSLSSYKGKEKDIRLQSFITEVGRHCAYFDSSKWKSDWGIHPPNPGAVERLGRPPVATDRFYLIINKNRDLVEWTVSNGETLPSERSIHFLISFYLTNNPKYRKILSQYDGKALKYLPNLSGGN